jgi:prepilin-type N-terminal cleavage/methylation domain-containing protein
VVNQRGHTLIEVVVSLAIFSLLSATLFVLTAEMRFWEKHVAIDMHKNPQVMSVLARLRRDVQDASNRRAYEDTFLTYTASEKVLIVNTINWTTGGQQTVVWDFRTPGEVRRRAYNVGVIADEWVTRGLPADFSTMQIGAIKTSDGSAWAAHIQARDENGRIAIDTILQPRATE